MTTTPEPRITYYEVTNRITGKVRNYQTSERATDAMDRADNAHGAVITTCRAVWSS